MQNNKMTRDEFFKLVPAAQFFPQYAPTVKRYYHKLRGTDGNKQPLDFSPEDIQDMNAGVKRLAADIKKMKF